MNDAINKIREDIYCSYTQQYTGILKIMICFKISLKYL